MSAWSRAWPAAGQRCDG